MKPKKPDRTPINKYQNAIYLWLQERKNIKVLKLKLKNNIKLKNRKYLGLSMLAKKK